MAAEEFQEPEVVFSDNTSDFFATHRHQEDDDGGAYFDHPAGFSVNSSVSTRKEKSKKKVAASSLPVNIPRHHRGSVFGGDFEEEDEEDMEEGDMVPPHVILGRRIAGKAAFSVCTGNGRTLKGRDLSRVRNSILRMTGFLEA
ncbi:Pentatricopeptide repeat superfamily protein [Hibiscus syriacus]|uniref:Pentatricopeptide repeat superfamily protein n=1 Tax=Hibiscus syriacus TaxID=106335 RepID=A0A6A2YCX2_HIBSY|nr:uncharacterized protein LOC120170843 [Hibiscus syriacus]KAE8673319.1 Pentatricopeptide repeat superfamily protein [Hibiscus syriacus]